MGSCCTSSINMNGELFIRELLKNKALKFRDYDYMDLLNAIVTKRVEQEIPIKHIREYLIPEIYESYEADNFDLYFQSIFEKIISNLEKNNNMYKVLFYFYPFINHNKEKTYENFFNCMRFMTKSTQLAIEREKVKEWLLKYVKFCTKGITEAVASKCPPGDEIYNSLEMINNKLFSEENLQEFVDRLKECLTDEKGNQSDLVTEEMYKKMINKYDIANLENVREILLKHDF